MSRGKVAPWTSTYRAALRGQPKHKAKRPAADKKVALVCEGGPWDGQRIWLTQTPGDRATTMQLSIHGGRGRYAQANDGKAAWWPG